MDAFGEGGGRTGFPSNRIREYNFSGLEYNFILQMEWKGVYAFLRFLNMQEYVKN